jgi:hypothetical protein
VLFIRRIGLVAADGARKAGPDAGGCLLQLPGAHLIERTAHRRGEITVGHHGFQSSEHAL